MTQIEIPDSLQFYYESSGNAQAIEALVEKIHGRDDGATEDMDWNDLAAYHRALLAAYQTQVDLWLFYKKLWEEIWLPAIGELNDLGALECETHEYEGELSLSNVWDEAIYRMHKIGSGRFVSHAWSTQKSIQIGFYFEGEHESYDLSNSLILSDSWKKGPQDDERHTESTYSPVRGEKQIDVAPLQEAALSAARAFKQAYSG
jgi:hypothetical protein